MIRITGTIGDRVYEDEIVSAKELSKMFNFEPTKEVRFELDPSRITYDPVNKRDRYAARHLITNYISGEYNGSNIHIVYYNREQKAEGGTYVRTLNGKRHFAFGGKAMVVDGSELERIMFMYLHTACKQSPIKGGTNVIYTIVDVNKEEINRLKLERSILEIKNTILNAPYEVLVAKAYNIEVVDKNGLKHKIYNIRELDSEALRSKLISLVNMNYDDFIACWDDPDSNYRASVAYLVDAGIIHLNTDSRSTRWVWDSSHGSEEIVNVRTGEDPMSTLYIALSTSQAKVIKAATNHMNNVIDSEVDRNSTVEDIIKYGIKSGMLKYDSETKSLLDKDGNVLKSWDEIDGDWMTIAINSFKSPVLRRKLTNALGL